MDIAKTADRLMAMSHETWMRHSNPLSGWTRMATTPLLFLAILSHVWIGWGALVPIALLLVWIWVNPRIFPKPKNANSWMTKGVLGERVWLNRNNASIPQGFERAANVTIAISAITMLLAIYGFIIRDFWLAFLGFHFSAFAKIWFVDRMVWLWEIMKTRVPMYAAWENELNDG